MTDNAPKKENRTANKKARRDWHNTTLARDIEPMIDAKQASAAFCLPYYWFADQAMRAKYRIPHYVMGGLVRYRLSELSAWAARNGAVQNRDNKDGNHTVGVSND